jgi:tetrahydromethanopterin S-methyltransferase subunit G
MSHLPPNGWNDVARRSETNQKFADIERRFGDVDRRFNVVEARLDRIEAKLEGLASMKRYVIGTGISLAGLICAFGIPLTLATLG